MDQSGLLLSAGAILIMAGLALWLWARVRSAEQELAEARRILALDSRVIGTLTGMVEATHDTPAEAVRTEHQRTVDRAALIARIAREMMNGQ